MTGSAPGAPPTQEELLQALSQNMKQALDILETARGIYRHGFTRLPQLSRYLTSLLLGDRPASRSLADNLHCLRNTIESARKRLDGSGWTPTTETPGTPPASPEEALLRLACALTASPASSRSSLDALYRSLKEAWDKSDRP